MSGFTNTGTPFENFLMRFESNLEDFKTKLDQSDLYKSKLTNLEKFKNFLAEFVKTHFNESLIEFQGQETFLTKIYGDNFEDLRDEHIKDIINTAKMDTKFADIKAQIQALSDLLMLTMEGGEGEFSQLMEKINNKLNDTGRAIVNRVREFMGYAALPGSIPPAVELTEEMSDGDIILAVLSLEHDPNDHSILYASGLTLSTDPSTQEDPNPGQYLIKEVKKIMYQKVKMREVIVEQKIPTVELSNFTNVRNQLIEELEELGKTHASKIKKYDTPVIKNLITHFIRKSSRVTRNSVKEVKNLINTLEVKLKNPINDNHTTILRAIDKLKDDIFKAENYVSPSGKTFIVQRIFSKSSGFLKRFVDGPLKIFMETLQVDEVTRDRLIEISTELLDNRGALKKLLEDNQLFTGIGDEDLGLDKEEQDELKETFITLLLNTEPENIVNAMPNPVEGAHNNNIGSIFDAFPNQEEEEHNNNIGSNNELEQVVENPNAIYINQGPVTGVKRPAKNQGNRGGKRKNTAKKNNKKSKATKKMKKIKRTMKRKTGKKVKKTSRRRR